MDSSLFTLHRKSDSFPIRINRQHTYLNLLTHPDYFVRVLHKTVHVIIVALAAYPCSDDGLFFRISRKTS